MIALLVLVIHLAVVALLLQDSAPDSAGDQQLLIQLRILPLRKDSTVNPALDSELLPLPAIPVFSALPPPEIPIEYSDTQPTVIPGDSPIFNPQLRQALSQVQSHSAAQPSMMKSWRDASGVRIVEVGDGECIKEMPGDEKMRGDNWSMRYTCGKSESERMMDRVNADLAERRKKSKP